MSWTGFHGDRLADLARLARCLRTLDDPSIDPVGPDEHAVLAAVTELCQHGGTASTSLIICQVSDSGRSINSNLQTSVRDTLERLGDRGELVRAAANGSYRWSLPASNSSKSDREEPIPAPSSPG